MSGYCPDCGGVICLCKYIAAGEASGYMIWDSVLDPKDVSLESAQTPKDKPAALEFFVDQEPGSNRALIWEVGSVSAYRGTHVIEYSALTEAREEIARLEQWKREMDAVARPIFEFEHPAMELGESRVAFLIRMAQERDSLKQEIARLKEDLQNAMDVLNNEQTHPAVQERDACLAECERLVAALKFECGNRCAEQNPCNAKEALTAHDRWLKERG